MGTAIKATENRELRCLLTEEERHAKAERVADVLEEIDDADAELRSAKARHKLRVEQLSAERDGALAAFRTGYELRPVPCELQLYLESNRAAWVRTDTGEVISERGLRDDERQGVLFGDAELEAPGEGEGEGDPEPEEPAEGPGGGRRQRGRRRSETTGAPAL